MQRRRRGHKAKDTKKIQGECQGQPFRGQTRSRPRTEMLETKAKDTNASAFQKKVFKLFFQAISKVKKILKKIFQVISKKKKKPV